MSDFEGYSDVKQAVEKNENVVTVEIGPLRDAHGADRLGKYVRKRISKKLERHGLGRYPQKLPSSQHEKVRIYRLGTQPTSDLIQAVTTPREDKGQLIREKVNSTAEEKLDRIGEMVCE